MLSAMQKPKRPRDANQLAKLIVDIATGAAKDETPKDDSKDPAAVVLGKKGGAARAAVLKPIERSEIALKAAKARWTKQKDRSSK